jgi:long-chain fatty acid transport protein
LKIVNCQFSIEKGGTVKQLILILVFSLFAVSSAYAGCVDTYGIGSKATALGGAYSAYANDPFAVYYNPAGLTQLDSFMISGGLHMMDPTIQVENYRVSNTNDPLIAGPKDFSDESPNLAAPHLGVATPISDTLAFGIAAYAPWGLELEWNDNPAENPAAYNYYRSYYIREVLGSPTLAWKVSDKLSFGFGVSLGMSKAGEERKLYVSPNLATDPAIGPSIIEGATSQAREAIATVEAANQDAGGVAPPITTTSAAYNFLSTYAPDKTAEIAAFKSLSDRGLETPEQVGVATAQESEYNRPATDHDAFVKAELKDDFNYSFNFGLMYKPTETITLGLAYRSRTITHFEGKLDKKVVTYDENGNRKLVSAYDNDPDTDKPDVELDYDHPDQVQLGIRYVPASNPDISIEFDLVWTNWSINEEQSAKITDPLRVDVAELAGQPIFSTKADSTYRRDWEDTKQIRVGVEWKIDEIFTLRGGYFYDPSPIRDDTLDLMWPDADKKIYSLGCGMNFGNFSVDSVFQYVDIEQARDIGGESENINHSYDGTGTHKEVSFSADGYLWGLGLTLNYKF